MANPMSTVKLGPHSIQLPVDVVGTHLSGWDLEEPLDGKLSSEVEELIQGYRVLSIIVSGGEVMQVPIRVLKRLNVIRTLIEDTEISEEHHIPMTQVSKQTMDYIMELFQHDDRLNVKDAGHADRLEHYITKASEIFASMADLSVAVTVIRDANYLDYPPMIDAAAARIGKTVANMSPSDIRGAFGIEREFTDAERQQVIVDFPELSDDSDVSLSKMRASCV
jgi:hypothetical protein